MSKFFTKVTDENILLQQDKEMLHEFYNYMIKKSIENKFEATLKQNSFTHYIENLNAFFEGKQDSSYVKDLLLSESVKTVAKSIFEDPKETLKEKSLLTQQLFQNVDHSIIQENVDIKTLEKTYLDKKQRSIVIEFLKNGYSTENNSKLLIHSIHAGDKEGFDLIIKNGANVNGPENTEFNRETPLGWKPSHFVKDRNEIYSYMVKELIKNGANINRFANTESHYIISAITAKDKVLVDTLIKNGAKINTKIGDIDLKDYIKNKSPDYYESIYNNNQKDKQIGLRFK